MFCIGRSIYINLSKLILGAAAGLKWAPRNVHIITLLFTFTVQKYVYPSVIVMNGNFEMQVNEPLPSKTLVECKPHSVSDYNNSLRG